jgi:arylamine N-acetyltransferase
VNAVPPSRAWLSRYLELLELPWSAPDLPGLGRLTRSHLSRVPFENVTSILRRGASPDAEVPSLDPELVLDSWLERRSGGVCFEVTEMFGLLLRGLGYHAYPVLAQISFPGSHQGLVVHVDGSRWLLDVANGAPLFEPIPLDGTVEVQRAGLAYRFRSDPSSADGWLQERWIDGQWGPFARYDLRPADQQARRQAYQRHHLRGQSWVVDSLRLVRCAEDEVCALRDGQLMRFTAHGKHVEPITEPGAYARLASDVFGLPRLPIAACLDLLQKY